MDSSITTGYKLSNQRWLYKRWAHVAALLFLCMQQSLESEQSVLTAAEACSGLEQQFETITSDVNPYDILSPCFQNGPQFTSQLYANITDALQRNGSVFAPNYTTGYFGSSDVPCTDDR